MGTSLESKSKVTVSTKEIGLNSAISNLVMRGGKHFATFSVSQELEDSYIEVGIIRPLPGWDKKDLEDFDPVIVNSFYGASQDLLAERTERWGTSGVNCCSYSCLTRRCCWSDWSDYHIEQWEGAES